MAKRAAKSRASRASKQTDVQTAEQNIDDRPATLGFPNMSGDAEESETPADDVEKGDEPAADAAPVEPAAPLTKPEQLAKCIDDTTCEITRFMPRLGDMEDQASNLKEQAASAKKAVEVNHKHLAMLCRRLADAKNGILTDKPYQPSLPLETDGAVTLPAIDEATSMDIAELCEHGLTEKMLEKLWEHDVKTIGDLEKRMREDEWWHKKIKGFGDEKVNKLIDSLLSFRKVYPVPEAGEVEGDEQDDVEATDDVEAETAAV